jgi:hypothetical protein
MDAGNATVRAMALGASLLSVVCCAATLFCVRRLPSLQTFPATVNAWMLLVDLAWFLVASASEMTSMFDEGTTICQWFAGPLFHWFSLVSVGWLTITAVNLTFMVEQQPMAVVQVRFKAAARTLLVAAFLVVLPLWLNDLGAVSLLPGPVYGPSEVGACNVLPSNPILRFTTQSMLALVSLFCASFLSIRAYTLTADYMSLAHASRVRRRIASRNSLYIASFTISWIPAIVRDSILLTGVQRPPTGVLYWTALFFFAQGAWDVIVYFLNKWFHLRTDLRGLFVGRMCLSVVHCVCPRATEAPPVQTPTRGDANKRLGAYGAIGDTPVSLRAVMASRRSSLMREASIVETRPVTSRLAGAGGAFSPVRTRALFPPRISSASSSVSLLQSKNSSSDGDDSDSVLEEVVASPRPTQAVLEEVVASPRPTQAVLEEVVASPRPTQAVLEVVASKGPMEANQERTRWESLLSGLSEDEAFLHPP